MPFGNSPKEGDKMNAVLCGAGHNMRKLLKGFLVFSFWLAVLRRFIGRKLNRKVSYKTLPR